MEKIINYVSYGGIKYDVKLCIGDIPTKKDIQKIMKAVRKVIKEVNSN